MTACLVEIERKFLVQSKRFLQDRPFEVLLQGYLPVIDGVTVRVRIVGEQGVLTVKGPTTGVSRMEFEYSIAKVEAQQMLNSLCRRPLIEKKRFEIEYFGNIWHVDEFLNDNDGLILAEIELQSEDQKFERPSWIGEEVSHDPRYFNSELQKYPYSQWGHE